MVLIAVYKMFLKLIFWKLIDKFGLAFNVGRHHIPEAASRN